MRNAARELLPTVQAVLDALVTDFAFGNIAVLGEGVITAEIEHLGVQSHLEITATGERILLIVGNYQSSTIGEPEIVTAHLHRGVELLTVAVLV